MKPFRVAVSAACIAALFATAPAAAAPADGGTLYVLVAPASAFETGCQGPCACPLLREPTFGSFSLVRTVTDPLYTEYAIEGYIASFNNGPGAVSITGSGRYRVGGEVALVQEMTLDLQVWGGPVQHFDSGLVPVSAPFPRLDIACAVNGFACLDTLLFVNAIPADLAGVPVGAGVPAGRVAVRPNPARGAASIEFTLARPGPVSLSIVDVEGRLVRTLANGSGFAAGAQALAWDGRREDGRPAPAGVYWAVLRAAGGDARQRFVRLD